MKTIIESIRILIVFTLLTGVLYPLAVTGVAKAFFRRQSDGSLVVQDGKIVGSALLAQKFDNPRYFAPRPSAADFATVASGASNKGPTSGDLAKAIGERRAKLGPGAPGDLLTASGSGLDPHISPAAAEFQLPRVAAERKMPPEKISALVRQFTEPPQFGILGEPRVNVFALNLALDALR
ncbi:MAG: potassium-transporting ATPase subunit KdpC [Chthoniobacteraceae bacterium]